MATWNAFVSKVRARVVKVVTGALRAAALPAADLAGAVARTRSRMRARVLLRLYKVAKQTLSRARTGHPRPFHRPGTAAGPPPGTGQPLAVVDNVVLASAATLPQTTRLLSGTSGSLPRAVAAMQKVDQTRVMTMIRVAVGRVPGRIVELCPAGPAPLLVAMTRRAEQPEKRPPGGNGRTVAPAGHQFCSPWATNRATHRARSLESEFTSDAAGTSPPCPSARPLATNGQSGRALVMLTPLDQRCLRPSTEKLPDQIKVTPPLFI